MPRNKFDQIVFKNKRINEIIIESSKHDSIDSFRKTSEYSSARRYGILDDVSNHMSFKRISKISNEDLKILVKKYSTLKDFRENENSAYVLISKRKLFKYLDPLKRVFEPFSYNQLKKISTEYSSISKLRTENSYVYNRIIHTNNQHLFENLSRHFDSGFDSKKISTFYVATVLDKAVKIGITNKTFKERYSKSHLDKMNLVIEIQASGTQVKQLETNLKNKLEKYPDKLLHNMSNTEIFDINVLDKILKEVNDFKNKI